MLARRDLLRGLFAAPAIVGIANIMPVRALPNYPTFLPGDLVSTLEGSWKAIGQWHPAAPVRRIVGDTVFIDGGGYGRYAGEVAIPAHWLRLFEGLPGNRVNNPSMRHRLIRPQGSLALRYPEDAAE